MVWVGILGVGVTSVWGAEYPSKPVRIVVPYVPGGSTDILARLIGQRLSEAWGQQFIIDNRPGAGGNIGSSIVAKSPADGYALVMATNGTHAINPSLYANMPYDAVNDFAPVILVAQVPLLLVVYPSLPVKSVRDLIALAKAHPGTLTFGSASTGSSGHLAGEMLKTVEGINTIHVPYKGDAPAVADLMGGQISFLFANMPAAVQYVRSDRLRGIAVTTPRRSPAVPDIPTMIESGIAGFEVVPWYGILGPAGMQATVISHLNTEVERILKLPDVKERMASLGAEAIGGTPEQFAAQIKSDIAKYAKAVKASGAKVN
jgi:tripartite-type tricarboxylate transporter receptor subunit TctC